MNYWKGILLTLSFISLFSCLALASLPDDNLHIVACDVGQGDAFLLTYKSSQILVDGGPGQAVLSCLGDNMPFWDKTVELVILTHPQTDHFGGLVNVFDRYTVNTFLASGLDSSSQDFEALKKRVGSQGVRVINPSSTSSIRLGKIYIDVVSMSDQEQSGVLGAYTSTEDPNAFSVVTLISFEEFDALFTGDIGPEDIGDILGLGEIDDVELLKVPHHGSKNGLTKDLLDASKPEIALISASKNNSYGHPHQEILDLLGLFEIEVYQTSQTGEIEVVSDGKTWQVYP